MRHAAVTFFVTFVLRVFGMDAAPAIKAGTVLSVGGEIVQWHVGPCVRGNPPSPLCGKPERQDVFAGIAGTLAAVAFTTPAAKPSPAQTIDLEIGRIRNAIAAECSAWKAGTITLPDSVRVFASKVCR